MEAQTEKKISTVHLQQGMYVTNLDRPWIDTPFLIQGFLIRDEEEINMLKKYCEHVFIDTDKGIDTAHFVHASQRLKTNERLEQCLVDQTKLVEYVDSKATGEEMPVARMAIDEASNRVVTIMESVKSGEKLDVEQVKTVVEPIVESIIRNPDALMWLTQMRHKDAYTYTHSVDNCALAIAFGRHMGLPKSDLDVLAMGLLLMDVGKMRIPAEVLNKAEPLTEAEYKLVRSHVKHSVDILKESEDIDIDIINIALTHHERFDGSGYPGGLTGPETPVYGRIAAIIDCYDAMTSKRRYAKAVPGALAIKKLYEWKDRDFQGELVEAFIQAIGIYPAGSLVELSTGEVAVVVAEYRTRRLRPQVMIVLDRSKQPLSEVRMLDLKETEQTPDGETLEIVNALSPDDYGIDMGDFEL